MFVPHTDFNRFTSNTIIQNAGEKTLIIISVEPSLPVGGAGSLVLYVPTRSEELVNVYANDLGSGIIDGAPINCQNIANIAGISCILNLGNQATGVPARITVSGFAGLAAGTLYQFFIDQIVNPSPGGDNKHVVMRLEAWNGGLIINSGLHYDGTIIA